MKSDPIAAIGCLVGLLGVIAVGMYTSSAASASPIQAAPTPAMAVLLQTAIPELPTATLPPAPRLSAPVTAYGAPDGAIVGPIEAGREYRVVARSGAGWVQADVKGSGLVWIRPDSTMDTANLPDIATPIPQPTSAPLPPAPQVVVVYQDAPAPAPVQMDQPPPVQVDQPAAPAPVGCPPNCSRHDDSAPPPNTGSKPMGGSKPGPTDPLQTESGYMMRTATP